MRYILATEDGGLPLLLSRPESAKRSTKLLDLPSVFRPVPRPLRGDRPVVVQLGLAKKLADCA